MLSKGINALLACCLETIALLETRLDQSLLVDQATIQISFHRAVFVRTAHSPVDHKAIRLGRTRELLI